MKGIVSDAPTRRTAIFDPPGSATAQELSPLERELRQSIVKDPGHGSAYATRIYEFSVTTFAIFHVGKDGCWVVLNVVINSPNRTFCHKGSLAPGICSIPRR